MNDNATEFETHDFFRSDRFVNDPYAYFDYLRAQAPVVREPHQGIVMVTATTKPRGLQRSRSLFLLHVDHRTVCGLPNSLKDTKVRTFPG